MRARRFFPRGRDGLAWLYLIERSDGVVKLGLTQNPHNRQQQHRTAAKAQRMSLRRIHLFGAAPKPQAIAAERRALEALAGAAKRISTEEFVCITFTEALGLVRASREA